MRQVDDLVTGDLLDGFKRPVGRPVSGRAKSAAARQADRRKRLKESGVVISQLELTPDEIESIYLALASFGSSRSVEERQVLLPLMDKLAKKRMSLM